MATAKRWRTQTFKDNTPTQDGNIHTTKKSAYELVTSLRRGYYVRRGDYPVDTVRVYVAEGRGYPFELHETIQFKELSEAVVPAEPVVNDRQAALKLVVDAALRRSKELDENELWKALDVLGVELHEFETVVN